MIDTIVLTLSEHMYHISEPEKFIPSAHWVTNPNTPRGVYSKQNPTTKELKAGIYKPHLSLYHRIKSTGAYEIVLKIELSLPKLIFGNNFSELQYKDFTRVCNTLVNVLAQMGVVVSTTALIKAPVSAVHYSKNIPLTDGSTPYHYINKIKEANVKPSLDVNQTDYRNEGHNYKWHSNSYEVVFYDKIKDLEKAKQSSKLSQEKDSALQLNLFEQFALNHQNYA